MRISRMTPAAYDLNVGEHRTALCPECRQVIRVGQQYVQAGMAVRPMHLACRQRFIAHESARLLARLGELGLEAKQLRAEQGAA